MTGRRRKGAGRPDLWIVGIGIRGLDQLTPETRRALERCRIVLHLTHQHDKLRAINGNLVDLETSYWTGEEVSTVYERLVRMVMEEVERGPEVALATYGHPMIFDDVTLQLVRRCRRKGFRCRVLPAVSCLDMLCIDLGIDYGYGLQVFEASDLVEQRLSMEKRVDTLILQLYEFGTDCTADAIEDQPGRFDPLVRHLKRFYAPEHPAVVVFSDDGSMGRPELLKTRIRDLETHHQRFFPGVTLYLPSMEHL